MEFSVDLSLDVLARTPATLRTLLEDVDAAWGCGTEGPDTFSSFDVVGHLIRWRGDRLDSARAPWGHGCGTCPC